MLTDCIFKRVHRFFGPPLSDTKRSADSTTYSDRLPFGIRSSGQVCVAGAVFVLLGLSASLQAQNYNPNNYDTANIIQAMQHWHSDLVMLTAHRGLHSSYYYNQYYPENSLIAIGAAAQAGIEMVEVDIKLSSDGFPMLSHDTTWGRETLCPGCTTSTAFNPFAANTPANQAKNPVVNSLTAAQAQQYMLWNVLNPASPVAPVATLQDALIYLKTNRIAVVLALDIKDIPTALACWQIVKANTDYLGRPFYSSVVFKMASVLFSSPDQFKSTFGTDFPHVLYWPYYTTNQIAPNYYGSEDNMIASYKNWRASAVSMVGSEINVKQIQVSPVGPSGILNKLYEYALFNTNQTQTIGIFQPVAEWVDPSHPIDPNDPVAGMLFFTGKGTSSGYCCYKLSDIYYNGAPYNQPSDTYDWRVDLGFATSGTKPFTVITTDDVLTANRYFANRGQRNISYLQAGYTPGTGTTTIAQQVAVPAYFYPTPGASPNYWAQLVAPVGIAIANVSNGPNYGVDPNYASAIARAHGAGVKVLGYVDTGYFGGTSPARLTRLNQSDANSWTTQIEQDVDAWYSLYGSWLDGIFFDDGQNVCGANNQYVTLYTDIMNYVKQNHPGAYVMTNPGTTVPQCLENIADTLLTFEGSYACYTNDPSCPAGQQYTPPSWNPVDPRKIFHAIYAVPSASLANASALSKQRNAGFVFMTDATLAQNPYGSLPSYFGTEVTNSFPGGTPDTTVPTPPDTLDTVNVGGTWATLNWGASTDSGGSGVVGYDIYQNGVWVTSVPTSSSPQVTVTGLQPVTSYSFTATARSAAGIRSALSNTLTFKTDVNDGGITPPTASAIQVNPSDVVLSWTAAQPNSYSLAYYDVFLNGKKILTLDAGILSADVIGLTSNTSYTFTVQARDAQGDVSPMSNTVTATTASLPNPQPCNVTISGTMNISCDYPLPWGFHHVYIDADNSAATGYLFNWTCPNIGADYLIENTTLLAHSGAQSAFSWAPLATIIPVITGSASTGFTYSWTIPLANFSGVPIGTISSYLMNGTGYALEEYTPVFTVNAGVTKVNSCF